MEAIDKKKLKQKYIDEHIHNINELFNASLDRGKYEILLELEELAHNQAEIWCERSYSDKEREEVEKYFISTLTDLLSITGHQAIFFNGDPRGYALKIKDDFIRDSKVNIYKDWGGYGIFAPDFSYLDRL